MGSKTGFENWKRQIFDSSGLSCLKRNQKLIEIQNPFEFYQTLYEIQQQSPC